MSDLDRSVREFLDEVAAPAPTATGGAVGAVTLASAAGLVAMTARVVRARASQAPGADPARLAERADRVRRRAAELADEDAAAYGRVLTAQRRPAADPERSAGLRAALAAAAGPPAELAALAAETASLAGAVAAEATPALRGDVHMAAALAAGCAEGAAALVRINLRAARADLGAADEADRHAAAARAGTRS